MKFGKEFVSQMVPEWQEAYMDYNYLKTLLKEVKCFKQINKPPAMQTLYRSFSGLTHFARHCHPTSSSDFTAMETQPIVVNSVQKNGNLSYETMFLLLGEHGAEYELVFFKRLDDEFNKVNQFYRSKVEQVMRLAASLNKQMDALISFRVKVQSPQYLFGSTAETTSISIDHETSSVAMAPSLSRASRRVHLNAVDQEGESMSSNHGESAESSKVEQVKEIQISIREETTSSNGFKGNRTTPPLVEILDQVKLNNNTPRSSIKGFLNPQPTKLNFTKENLKSAEQKLKQAFIQFYYKLHGLKSYRFLNILAFSKIMKKYDKITSRNASKSYLKMVDESYLKSSDKVNNLVERVEATFIKHFVNSNRRKGMNMLRPTARTERHRLTFSAGFFAGCTAALIISLILIIHSRNLLHLKEEGARYMENMFPLYSFFGFIVLHMLMYAGNIYFWGRYRVNYSFIFGLKPGTELGYREVLLLSFGLAVLAEASVLANLDLQMDPKTQDYQAFTELIPLVLLVLLFVLLICPLNIFYRSSRFFFLTCLFHCLCAPLYKVTFPDFLLADHLTSQVQALRSLEFYICYYGWGDYKHRQNTCNKNGVYNTFNFIVAVVPYWSRLLQCLRRMLEEKDMMQGYNGLKYFSTIVAVSVRTAYSTNKEMDWKIAAWVSSAVAAIIGTYWDLVKDWGLLQKNAKNRWLRDKLLVPHKTVYFGAMVLNVLLRFAWLQTVLDFQVSVIHKEALIAIVASLEIIRRGIWNFFRVENEHLNNVGKFRAFKSVPLPFSYDEDDGEKDV